MQCQDVKVLGKSECERTFLVYFIHNCDKHVKYAGDATCLGKQANPFQLLFLSLGETFESK